LGAPSFSAANSRRFCQGVASALSGKTSSCWQIGSSYVRRATPFTGTTVATQLKSFHLMFPQFVYEEEGQTLVEYGLLISLIALVVIAVLTLLGSRVKGTFNTAASNMKAVTS